jgi:hypothetical protein
MPASPSLLIVPARFKTGKLYTQIATTSAGVVLGSSGDFNVTRGTTATRFNSAGLIESVASGVPRLDYYTSGGTAGCPALLVEPSAQNSALQSENFTTTWATASLNITSGFTSPTNSNLGALIEASAAGGRLRQSVTLTSGATLDFSCFAKLGTLSSGVSLVFQDGTNTNYTSGACQAFRLDTGQLASSGSTGAGFTVVRSGIENYGNGWYRCNLAVTMGYTPAAPNIMIRPTAALTSSIPVAVSGDTCYIFGAQLEVGSIPTSYIPTTAAAVTRNADVITLSGAVSGCIGQTEGTIYAEVNLSNLTAGKAIMQIDDGTTTNRIACFVNTNPNRFEALVAGGGVATILSGSITTGTHKASFSYSSGSVQVYLDGVFLASGTPTNFPTVALTNMSIGSRISAGVYGAHLNDRIRSLALYTTRLTNVELAALTTP